jgi:hypothetical protein
MVKEPSHKMVVQWLVEVYNNIPEEIRRNAWKEMGFEWF